ncbi:MAG: hypothetical protein PHC78_05135 [Verrucomicrobiota bacterium]|nr:hypothetical protein [Verrucomicrobiota bacterium]
MSNSPICSIPVSRRPLPGLLRLAVGTGSLLWLLLCLTSGIAHAQAEATWASRVVDYEQGIGAVPPFFQPSLALGPIAETAHPLNGSLQVVSIGQGGHLTLAFETPVENHLGQPDFIVFGNAFYSNAVERVQFQEPGWVEVAVDHNGNGTPDPDEPFYLLAGGMLPHPGTPPEFPLPPEYSGSVDHALLPTTGYCDVTPTCGTGDPTIPDDPLTPGLTEGSAGGDAFDLDWAVDAAGAHISLTQVDFIRIHNAFAGTQNIGSPGTSSTEVDAIAVLPRLNPAGDPAATWELW